MIPDRRKLRLAGLVVLAAIVLACDPAAVPGGSSAASFPGIGPTDPPGSGGVPIPAILSKVEGFDVVGADAAVVAGFREAASASLGGAGRLGDLVAAKAVRAGDEPVEMYAFTVIPVSGVTENDAARLIFDAVAAGAGGEWVAHESEGWFQMDHPGGTAIFGALGTVPGGFVFGLLTGAGDAPVEAVAAALFRD